MSRWEGFWYRKEKYVLSGDGMAMNKIPQRFYEVNVIATVAKKFPIYSTARTGMVVSHATPGSEVVVMIYDSQGDRYLIKDMNGILGWIRILGDDGKFKDLP